MGIIKVGGKMFYIPYTQFVRMYDEALEIKDPDMYISERGWQDWMNRFDIDVIVKTLDTVRSIALKSFSELRKEIGLSQAKMACAYGLKTRTIENWESGSRTPPEHDKLLLSYVIFLEIMNREEGDDSGNITEQD